VKNLFGSNVEATAAAVGDASSAAERPQSSDDRKVQPSALAADPVVTGRYVDVCQE